MRCLNIIVVLFLIVPSVSVCAADNPAAETETPLIKWLDDAANRASIEKAARGHELYVCLVNAGSYGEKEKSPRYARYELFADIKFASKGVINGADFNVPSKLTRFVYGESAPREIQTNAFGVAYLFHDLLRNDFLSLPERTVNPLILLNIEDPYDMVVYLKVGDKSVYVRRDSFHNLCRKLHEELESMWESGRGQKE